MYKMHRRRKITSFRGEHFFLSNFYPCEVLYDGKIYRSVEHAFQAAKCADDVDREKIRMAPTAAVAKRIGRKIKMKPNWDADRIKVMEQLLRFKFANPSMRGLLITTIPQKIIEENKWHDIYWGVCTCEKHQSFGQNHLGKLLMKIREDLKLKTKCKLPIKQSINE